ncbi:MAG: glycosyltransferase, partial [Candidatus Micrarchaeia archaeon]
PKRIQNVRGASLPKVIPEVSLEKLRNVAFGTPDTPYEEDTGQYDELIEIDAVNGLVKKEVFERIGLYDEKFFFTYDDADFCYRAKQAGYRIVTNPKAKMWHVGAGTVSAVTSFYIYHSYRGKLRFGLKHFKGMKKVAFIIMSIIALPFLILRFIINCRFDLVTALVSAYGWNLINFKDYL